MTFSPTICIGFDGLGTLIAAMFAVGVVCYWWGKVSTDRSWELDIRRRTAQQINAPWLHAGEPVLVSRIDAAETIFRRNPYRHEGVEPLRWAA